MERPPPSVFPGVGEAGETHILGRRRVGAYGLMSQPHQHPDYRTMNENDEILLLATVFVLAAVLFASGVQEGVRALTGLGAILLVVSGGFLVGVLQHKLASVQRVVSDSSTDNTTMTDKTVTVTREPCTETSASRDFYDEVAHGSADYGDYPFIYKVEVNDEGVFYGFKTNLPESREPWSAGFVSFTRDTVLDARTGMEVDGEMKELVNDLIDLLGEQP